MRTGPQHYTDQQLTADEQATYKPGDQVDYYADRIRGIDRLTAPAVVLRVTSKRVVIRVKDERRHRAVLPVNLSKRPT